MGKSETVTPKHGERTDPLISVIVPVYNVRPWLNDCLVSILAQTYERIEVIVVDDGSNDGSAQVYSALARRDGRIRVFRKENGGLSSARNFGVRKARGEWIAFVDSDDVVDPEYLRAMLHAARRAGADMAVIPGGTPFAETNSQQVSRKRLEPTSLMKRWRQSRRGANTEAFTVVGPSTELIDLFYQRHDNGAQFRLTRAEIVRRFPYPQGIRYEDLATTYKYAIAAKRIAVINSTSLYNYRIRTNSIMGGHYEPQDLFSCNYIYDTLLSDQALRKYSLESAIRCRMFSLYRVVYGKLIRDQDWKELSAPRTDVTRVLRKNARGVMVDSRARTRDRLAACTALFGERAFRRFCQLALATGSMR